MNKALAVAVILGTLVLGGLFFVAGFFSGISVTNYDKQSQQQKADNRTDWPPVIEQPNTQSSQNESHLQSGLSKQTQSLAENQKVIAVSKSGSVVDQAFSKVPVPTVLTPMVGTVKNEIKQPLQQGVMNATDTSSNQKNAAEQDNKAPQQTENNSQQIVSYSPQVQNSGLVVKPVTQTLPIESLTNDTQAPSVQDAFESDDEEIIPKKKILIKKNLSDEFEKLGPIVIVGNFPNGRGRTIVNLLEGRGYDTHTLNLGEKMLILTGPFKKIQNAKRLLNWLNKNRFDQAKMLLFSDLKNEPKLIPVIKKILGEIE